MPSYLQFLVQFFTRLLLKFKTYGRLYIKHEVAYIFIGVGVEGEDFRGHIVSGDET